MIMFIPIKSDILKLWSDAFQSSLHLCLMVLYGLIGPENFITLLHEFVKPNTEFKEGLYL